MARAVEFLGEALAVGLIKHLLAQGSPGAAWPGLHVGSLLAPPGTCGLCPAGPPGRQLLRVLSWGSLGSRLTEAVSAISPGKKDSPPDGPAQRPHRKSLGAGTLVPEKDKFQKYREHYSDFLLSFDV